MATSEQMLEIRWHGRGGQGAKTVATFLAEVCIKEGKHSQGFPEYGPERSGAPMRGYTRVCDKEIRIHSSVENPDVVVVLDETLLDAVDVCEGLTEEGVILVNTAKTPTELRSKLGLEGREVYSISATQIALDELGKNIPNTPMMGALLKVTGVISLETLVEEFGTSFVKKFSQKIIEGNLKAIKRAYEEVKGE